MGAVAGEDKWWWVWKLFTLFVKECNRYISCKTVFKFPVGRQHN